MLARKPKWASRKEPQVVTTFVFEVRNIPAALYKALGGFATNGINMTKLESYMVDGSFAATQFYADVEGHPKDRALELALEELEFVSQPKSLKILGVYPGHRFRETFQVAHDSKWHHCGRDDRLRVERPCAAMLPRPYAVRCAGCDCRSRRLRNAGDETTKSEDLADVASEIHAAGARFRAALLTMMRSRGAVLSDVRQGAFPPAAQRRRRRPNSSR